MVRCINWMKLSLILTIALVANVANAQSDTRNGAVADYSSEFVSGGCATCSNAVYGQQTEYAYGHGHRGGVIRRHTRHLLDIHHRDAARNEAWPKPFNCVDRQLYHNLWNPMLDAGCRANCLFTSLHFDPETNELNEIGQAKIRAIFRNFVANQKYALVQFDGNPSVTQARLRNLQSSINSWYGADAFTEVAISNMHPSSFAGNRAEMISNLALEQTAPPIIPVATGEGSTNNSVVGR